MPLIKHLLFLYFLFHLIFEKIGLFQNLLHIRDLIIGQLGEICNICKYIHFSNVKFYMKSVMLGGEF